MADRVKLSEGAHEVALAEAQAVLVMVQEPERRGRLADLIAAIEEGELDEEQAGYLEELLELGLQTGRVRALYGPAGEQAALRTYRRLPRGRAQQQAAREVSEALKALTGATLDGLSLSAEAPGVHTLAIAADGRELLVRLDRNGAFLKSVSA